MGNAVFLSFAAQDAEFARRIAGALRATGAEVWLDLGDAAEDKLRSQINACGLFMPLISANSQSRHSGHFRVEWKLAAERLRASATGGAFLLPIIIDATLDADARVPADFKTVPWTRMLDGDASPAFCARVQRLLAQQAAAPAALGDLSGSVTVTTEAQRRGRSGRRVAIAALVALGFGMIGGGLFYWWRTSGKAAPRPMAADTPPAAERARVPEAAAPTKTSTASAVSSGREARALAAEAQQLLDAPGLDALSLRRAEGLAQRALALEPRDAEVLATAAFVAQQLYVFDYERAPHRLDEARGYASRAVAAAPENFQAQLAVATGHDLAGQSDEAARLLRGLAARAPDNPRVQRALAHAERAEQATAKPTAKPAPPVVDEAPLKKLTGAAASAANTPAVTPQAGDARKSAAAAPTPLTADAAERPTENPKRTNETGSLARGRSGERSSAGVESSDANEAGNAGGTRATSAGPTGPATSTAASRRADAERAAEAAAEATAAETAPSPTSLAVLPFVSEPSSPDDDELAEGVSDELRDALGRASGLQVAAQTSAAQFKNSGASRAVVARRLGVEHLVEGCLMRAAGQVRLTARLVRAVDGVVLWEGGMVGEEATVFAAKEQLARNIARSLKLPLSPGGPVVVSAMSADELAAHRLYWAARRAWGRRDPAGYDRAEELLNRALALAPRFVRAHAALADVWELRGEWDNSVGAFGDRRSPALRRIQAKVAEALAIDASSPEAHASRGLAQLAAWDFAGAEQALRTALALNPNFATAHQWLGRALLSQGRMDEALVALQRAVELDPLASRVLDNHAWALRLAGRREEALVLADRALNLQPDAIQARELKEVLLAELGRGAARPVPAHAMPDAARLAGGQVDRVLFDPGFDHLRTDPRWVEMIARLGLTEAHARAQSWRAAHSTEGRR